MNTFGRKFRISVFGESHGAAVGAVLDGVPAGTELEEQDFEMDLSRRKSGAFGTTPRKEEDRPQVLSGVLGGRATGAPLTIVFRNSDVRSSDYTLFKEVPRPGHADFVAGVKWHDFNDPRGGGHFSGRLTLPVVAAGVVAKKIVSPRMTVRACLVSVGGVGRADALSRAMEHGSDSCGPDENIGSGDPSQCRFSDSELWRPELETALEEGDSLGGVCECTVTGVPVGLGEPFFDSAESLISHAVFSIPGVRGIEFGDGFRAASMKGSEHNDPIMSADGRSPRNGAGGVNGGITNGNPLVFRVAFKPTSSIRKLQHTYNFTSGKVEDLEIPGRHDVCFALRSPVIVEAMTALVLADLSLL